MGSPGPLRSPHGCWGPLLRPAFRLPLSLGLLPLLLTLLPLLSCRPSGPAGEEVRFWAMGKEGEIVRQLLPGFTARFPDIRVRLQQVPWSAAHEKILTAFVAGTLPDVLQVGTTWVPELAAIGALAPIERDEESDWSDFFPGVLATGEVDGVLHAVPWYVDTRLLFFRRDLLLASGTTEVPVTWDGWHAALQRLAAFLPSGAPLFAPLEEWQLPVILAWREGAELLREGDRFGNFRSPAFRRAFEAYADLFRTGLAPVSGGTQVANVYQDFAAGFFAVYVTGPWNLGEFSRRLPPELAGAWDTAPIPGDGPGQPGVSIAGGAGLALVRGTPRAAAARRLIDYLTSPDVQREFHRLSGDLPTRRSVWEDPSLAADPRAEAFRQQLTNVRPPPRIPEWERMAALIGRQAEAVVRGKATIDQALVTLDAEADRILEKRRWMLTHRAGGDR